MNMLRLYTVQNGQRNTYDTYWSTGLITKGVVRCTIPSTTDDKMAAELAVAQHLLVDRNVAGHHKSGAGLVLTFSGGAVRKLMREQSDKYELAGYANFLKTRFLGAEINVESRRPDWVDEACLQNIEELRVEGPAMCMIEVPDLGLCELTAHAVQQYQTRFGLAPQKIWRKLIAIASTCRRQELPNRSALHDVKHRRAGQRWVTPSGDIGLVITPPAGPGRAHAIVTVLSLKYDGNFNAV